MMKKITLRMFLAVVCAGIWQVLCAIGRVFNYKNKTPFWRTIWVVLTLCVVIFTVIFSYYFYKEQAYNRYYDYTYNSKYLSSHIYYHKAKSYRRGYILDNRIGKKVLSGLDWVICSPGDSLAVFSKNHKRGYLNIYTGKIEIPAIYSKAWIFSDGVAAVMENDSIYFINHDGKRIFNQGFEQWDYDDDYVFKNGCSKVKLNGLFGAIDKSGKICVPFEYEYVRQEDLNFWAVYQDGKWGVFNDSAKLIFPCEYRMVSISKNNGIYLTDAENYCRRYSFTGELLDNFVVKNVSELDYDSQVVDDEGSIVYKTANCLLYEVPFGMYGLMTKDGHPLTAPQFRHIEAISEDLYLCHYENDYNFDDEGVLMNSNGAIVRQ